MQTGVPVAAQAAPASIWTTEQIEAGLRESDDLRLGNFGRTREAYAAWRLLRPADYAAWRAT